MRLTDKINMILQIYKEARELAIKHGQNAYFVVELECGGWETETEIRKPFSQYTCEYTDVELLFYHLMKAVDVAKIKSRANNCTMSVRVWIKTYKYATQLDEVVLNDYELNFERGVEI